MCAARTAARRRLLLLGRPDVSCCCCDDLPCKQAIQGCLCLAGGHIRAWRQWGWQPLCSWSLLLGTRWTQPPGSRLCRWAPDRASYMLSQVLTLPHVSSTQLDRPVSTAVPSMLPAMLTWGGKLLAPAPLHALAHQRRHLHNQEPTTRCCPGPRRQRRAGPSCLQRAGRGGQRGSQQ